MLNPAQNKAIDDYIEFSGTEGYCWPFFPEPKISNLKRKILSTEPWKSNITEVDLENILFKIQIKLTKNNIPDDYTGLFRDLPQGKEVMINLKKHIIEYLETPPDRGTLAALIHQMQVPVRDVVRQKEPLYAELALHQASDEAVLDAMLTHPQLINRPIVRTAKGVALCRPPETVRALL